MISSITPFTLQDFPNHTACIIWFMGCNFRCPYCHNPEFVLAQCKIMDFQGVVAFLNSRKNLLDGVVLSGGECTISPMFDMCVKHIKEMGFLLKVDTNGTSPSKIKTLLSENLLDYVALDYKAPESKFKSITSFSDFKSFSDTLDLLIGSNIAFEVRTTVHTDLLNEDDIALIIHDLETRNYKGTYFVQNYFKSQQTLGLMDEQQTILNIHKLPVPKSFQIQYRNFDI